MSERYTPIISLVFLLASALLPAVGAAKTGSDTGLSIPRFVTLKSSEVNIRTGPGTRYPIQWVYRRQGLPVEIVEEFDLWRKVRDMEGTEGWIHKSMLSGGRSAIIQGAGPQIIRANPDNDARAMFKAEPKVQADVIECEVYWCRLQIAGRKGWLEKKYLWGVYSSEVFD
ncbi:MAG: SH3 domain-containing protein [Alphaproteobacteria bacterium]